MMFCEWSLSFSELLLQRCTLRYGQAHRHMPHFSAMGVGFKVTRHEQDPAGRRRMTPIRLRTSIRRFRVPKMSAGLPLTGSADLISRNGQSWGSLDVQVARVSR